MENNICDYYLGLDIGTDSVGWAVTDLNYNLLKFNGKSMWGVRLFDSGNTAAKRRSDRASRRRYKRRRQRINFLQEIFAENIFKVDPGFFQRLEDSKYYIEDKNEQQPNTLFNDKDFKDKDYHKLYPTIYHLRKALLEDDKVFDVRLVYLALHHIIKKRGHFLFEGTSINSFESFAVPFEIFIAKVKEVLDVDIECKDLDALSEIISSKRLSVKDKVKQISELLPSQNAVEKEIVKLLAGGTVTLSILYADDLLVESDMNKLKITDNFTEENLDNLAMLLDNRVDLIIAAKQLYDWSMLSELKKKYMYVSEAKVADYEKHRNDLQLLKRVINKYYPEKFNDIFNDPNIPGNYCSYVDLCMKNKRKIPVAKKCTREEFYNYIKGILEKKKNLEDRDINYILAEIETQTFLPKQKIKDNTILPYQLHLEELERILDNASKYLDFLNFKDETGFTNKEKIIKIMTFRIPYYVGPLNDAHKIDDGNRGNCWVVKKSKEQITPWNFESMVDVEASAEKFISRMTGKCSYLKSRNVIPKHSLIYSEFMVLNQLNNLRVNGEKLPVDLKKRIFDELFKKYNKVTLKRVRDFLEVEGVIEKDAVISGIDGDFNVSLTSYIDFSKLLGNKVQDTEMIENIIRSIVLFGQDKKLLRAKITRTYKDKLTEDEIEGIMTLSSKYSGWGRLSREFLTEIYSVDKETGEYFNIISGLRNTKYNLNELLSKKYDFYKEVNRINREELPDFSGRIDYALLDDLYVSPKIKRGIWQALLIVDEIRKIMKRGPKKIFLEVAREPGEKVRTKSRKQQLIELYKAIENDSRDWIAELEGYDDNRLRQDKLFLYYTQMGRCMYSGEPIPIDELFTDTYDIDHIYPRRYIKDDSLNNTVLVKKIYNAVKGDKYPINYEWQKKNITFWRMLYEKGFIGMIKYERLTRKTELTDDELAGFIARQLVEVRQSTKAVADILKSIFGKSTEVVYTKASLVNDFRNRFNKDDKTKYYFYKVRELNDFHHAKDAYLNIVVGNVYNVKFTHDPLNFVKKSKRDYSFNTLYDYDVVRNGYCAWKAGPEGTIKTVHDTYNKSNIQFTRYSFESKGEYFDSNPVKKGSGQFPLKGGDYRLSKNTEKIAKYGGYNKLTGAYYVLVEHGKENKRVRSIEHVPLVLKKQLESDNGKLIAYLIDQGLINPRIIIPKIKVNTLFCINGYYLHLSGRSENRLIYKNGVQLVLKPEEEEYLKKIFNYLNKAREAKIEVQITSYDQIDAEKNLKLYDLLTSIMGTNTYNQMYMYRVPFGKLKEGRQRFVGLKLEDQCKALEQILSFFKCRSIESSLVLIGGSKNTRIFRLPNEISKLKNVHIIHQSVTGLFQKKVNLLK
ncbi:MAG: type II CRISPR RNA-guided endonuclease Cas9 [Clostridiales bacterium]|nr:type II CRISPR RNA-guided endonuclease Cas9 [Clostridiales bacterium]